MQIMRCRKSILVRFANEFEMTSDADVLLYCIVMGKWVNLVTIVLPLSSETMTWAKRHARVKEAL